MIQLKITNRKLVINIITILIVILLLFVLSKSCSRQSKIVCNNINIKVSNYDKIQMISDSDIYFYLQREDMFPIGKTRSEINLSQMEKILGKIEVLKNVSCSFSNKGDVNVSVEQRIPIFRVKEPNEDYYIDSERKKILPSSNYSAYVPLVTGNVNYEFAKNELYDFIKYLSSKERWSTAFTQIYVYPNNDIELIPRIGDFIIRLGQLENYEDKLFKLDKFLGVNSTYNSWDKYCMINLEFKDQVVCTKKE